MADMNSILFGERVEKKDADSLGWITLYDGKKENPRLEKTTLLGKRSVVFFPGDGTKSERAANGCCKAVQGMLKQAGVDSADMPHFYGLAYDGNTQVEHRYHVLTQLKQAQFGSEYVPNDLSPEKPYYQIFFDEYILPLLMNEKGKPRSVSEIKKNIQNVTFATHCHGGFVAYQIEKMLAEKLSEIYPDHMRELMNNVRMLHFSSRRPKGQSLLGKHIDIISQNDELFADEMHLEYDDIHQQIHRNPLAESSAFIDVSPNEELIVLRKVTDDIPAVYGEDSDHSKILQIFSGEVENTVSENTPVIQLVRQILRHFVEHPEDKRKIKTQLEEINPSLVKENVERGKNFLNEEQANERIRRGLLSLLSDVDVGFSSRKKVYKKNGAIDARATRQQNNFLRQKDDKGQFLYEQLKKNYLSTGKSVSLIHYIKDIGAIYLPPKERGDLILTAVQNHDWRLFDAVGGEMQGWLFEQVSEDFVSKIISAVSVDDLVRLLPFWKNSAVNMNSDSILKLMRKSRKIKKVLAKNQLDITLKGILGSLRKAELKMLLKSASMAEKKFIKGLLAEKRQEEANRLFGMMRERDKLAPELRISQMEDYHNMATQYSNVTLQHYREFVAHQKKSSSLTFDSFFREKRRAHQGKDREV